MYTTLKQWRIANWCIGIDREHGFLTLGITIGAYYLRIDVGEFGLYLTRVKE
jgi:hypothetical protein